MYYQAQWIFLTKHVDSFQSKREKYTQIERNTNIYELQIL